MVNKLDDGNPCPSVDVVPIMVGKVSRLVTEVILLLDDFVPGVTVSSLFGAEAGAVAYEAEELAGSNVEVFVVKAPSSLLGDTIEDPGWYGLYG